MADDRPATHVGGTRRNADKRPHDPLAAMFERLEAALDAWMAALDPLTLSH